MVKITPAHDANDFEVGLRHNLDRIVCINLDGTMNENAIGYEGLDRFIAREKMIGDLKKYNPDVEKSLFASLSNVNLNTVISYQKDKEKHSFLDDY